MTDLTVTGVCAYKQMSLWRRLDIETLAKAQEATRLQGEAALQLLAASVQEMPPVIPGQPGRLINITT